MNDNPIDWSQLKLTAHQDAWMVPMTTAPFEIVVSGTPEAPDPAALARAKSIVANLESLKGKAERLIGYFSKLNVDWYFEGIEVYAEPDHWRAEYILLYAEDSIGLYVGFRNDSPFYVMQRLE